MEPEINLRATLECGQVFHWTERPDGAWEGLIGESLVVVREEKGRLEVVEAEGGPFKHPKFLKCIEIGKESFAEARRRAKVKGKLHYVHYVADGVMTLSTDINDRKTKQEGALNLANESELPEIIKSNAPILQMLSHGEGIPEIGMRLSENEFFVIELLESNVA